MNDRHDEMQDVPATQVASPPTALRREVLDEIRATGRLLRSDFDEVRRTMSARSSGRDVVDLPEAGWESGLRRQTRILLALVFTFQAVLLPVVVVALRVW